MRKGSLVLGALLQALMIAGLGLVATSLSGVTALKNAGATEGAVKGLALKVFLSPLNK